MDEKLETEWIRKEGVRFPVYKRESSYYVPELEKTLAKPHGYRNLMSSIIKELRRGPKQYRPLRNRLGGPGMLTAFDQAVQILLTDGIVVLESKNTRPRRAMIWEPSILYLDPRIAPEPEAKKQDPNTLSKTVLAEASAIMGDTDDPVAVRLLEQLSIGRLVSFRDGATIAVPSAHIKYKSVALALAYALVLRRDGRHEPIRIVSERIWHRSKVLDRYKAEIAQVAGLPLTKLNLTSRFEYTALHGDVLFETPGGTISGLAGYPTVVTDETIRRLTVSCVNATKLLIVENIAVFREILFRKYFSRPDILVFWGAGYLSGPKKRFLEKILKCRPIPVLVWADIDADGLNIFLDIHRIAGRYGARVEPLLMTEAELAFLSGDYVGADHLTLEEPAFREFFGAVVDAVLAGKTLEQEDLLIHYDKIEEKLP